MGGLRFGQASKARAAHLPSISVGQAVLTLRKPGRGPLHPSKIRGPRDVGVMEQALALVAARLQSVGDLPMFASAQ
jgi:hypothetical protein